MTMMPTVLQAETGLPSDLSLATDDNEAADGDNGRRSPAFVSSFIFW
jgi:hypothetical protein